MLSQYKAHTHTHTHTHTQHCTEQGQQWHQRTGQRLHCFFTNYVLPLSLSSLFPWHDRWTPVSEGLPYYCERPFGKEVKTKSDLVKLKGEGEKILWEVFCERNRKHQWMERSLWVPLTTFLFSLSVKPKLKRSFYIYSPDHWQIIYLPDWKRREEGGWDLSLNAGLMMSRVGVFVIWLHAPRKENRAHLKVCFEGKIEGAIS